MTARDFLDWMLASHCRSAANVVRTLDCSRRVAEMLVSTARADEPVEIKRTFALAMSAVAQDLKPCPPTPAEGRAPSLEA